MIFGVAYAFFKIQNALTKGGIRSEEADELAGLDMPEMGVLAYPEFVEQDAITLNAGGSPTHEEPGRKVDAPV